MNRTNVLVVFCLLLSAALAQNTPGPNVDTRSVVVTATGTAYGEPDEASFDAGVSVLNADVQAATERVNEQVSSLINALKAAGVAERDVRTVNFSIFPEPRYDNQGQVTQMRYRVLNTLRVTVRDTAQLGTLLGASVEAGANDVSNVVYTFSNRGVLERQARKQAMAKARQKATQLARFGQTQLGEVRRITEGGNNADPFADEDLAFAATDLSESARFDVPVSSGQLAVTVSVQVTFGLR